MTNDDYRDNVLRRLTSLETDLKDVKNRINSVEQQNAVEEVHRKNVEIRLSSIEDTLTWLVRLIIGAIILALIGIVTGGLLA